jgi:hypothetical protein
MALPSVVTIAVPSYNQGRFLEDALNSIFEQTCQSKSLLPMPGRQISQSTSSRNLKAGFRAGAATRIEVSSRDQ